jgi:riboflavin kinase/FMN adenylyltransferase
MGQVPPDGVYAGWLTDEAGVRWPAAISAGFNPTFNGRTRHIEAHVIGRPREAVGSFNLYGQTVVLEFVARLRGMISFSDSRALIEKMHSDVELARTILADRKEDTHDHC